MSTPFQIGILSLARLATIIGLGLLLYGATFLYSYIVDDVKNPVRHEYLEGMALCIFISFPFWLLASIAIFFVRKEIPKWAYILWNSPLIILLTTFIGLLLYIVVLARYHSSSHH